MASNVFNNIKAGNYNPLGEGSNSNPLGGGAAITQKTIGNSLGNVTMPEPEQVKLEEQLPVPTEFKNIFIDRLC
jgi:hypothetical protein